MQKQAASDIASAASDPSNLLKATKVMADAQATAASMASEETTQP